ncbi:hypothetical protein JYT72_01015, partial [Crocinitomix catalasitica]|nr:hypothetical protein [Crocinitomix catalasitica]
MQTLKYIALIIPIVASNVSFSQDKIKDVSVEDLQGLWTSHGYVIDHSGDGLHRDSDFEHIWDQKSLFFDSDSLWTFQYPCRLISVTPYTTDRWQIIGNSLKSGAHSRRTYIRKSFDREIIEKLKNQILNPDCYVGKWRLERTTSGGDGTGVEYIFPFKVSDILEIKPYQLDEPSLT